MDMFPVLYNRLYFDLFLMS